MNKQRGASLLIALIFLVIMAMLSVTLANVSRLEENMAGNTRDRDLALQAAEASVRDAELRLAVPAFRATVFPAFNAVAINTAQYWENCFTAAVVPCAVTYLPTTNLPTAGAGKIAEQPRFIIERKPNVGLTEVYRVTSRAVGGSTDTVVVLQAEFGVTP
jgi:type IV pilus assembly protein PilX